MQGASVKQARAFVASGRGRRQPTEAGADLRSKYADSPRNAPARYRCGADRASCPGLDPSTDPPNCGESNSMQGAGVRKTSRQRRVGRTFPTAAQTEIASQNLGSDWDALSRRQPRRKLHPGIDAQNGMHFPDGLLAESSSRNPRSERDTLSQRRSKRKVHPGIAPQNGTCFPPAASSTPKPMPPPFQNWVEESQNAIAGGQYDCRRQGKERRQGRTRPGGR